MKTALLVLDVQKDFCLDSGRFPVARHHVEPMIANINSLVESATARGHEIIYIVNTYLPTQVFSNLLRNRAAMKGTVGAEFDHRLNVVNQNIYPKKVGSALSNTDLVRDLEERQIRHLVIAGLYAEGCVKQTTVDALKRGYEVTVFCDAVASKSDRTRSRTLTRLQTMDARVCTASDDVFCNVTEAGEISARAAIE